MDARGIIYSLREGTPLSADEIAWFAQGLASGEVTDAQAGAFAMAVCLNGLRADERVALTLAMRDTGKVLSWDLPGPVVDKHSTGGLGDCTSLLLAPMLAAAGVYNPMISGRGLGHTGGTLDKLEAIPGLVTEVSEERFRAIVAEVGCAIVSAGGGLAPADKRLYAVRDVTSTVESIDLITASILSKKLAGGPEAMVLDVKVGSGAFMATAKDAMALAAALVDTANDAGCRTTALVTDMNQPLAPSVGNAVEVAECMAVLTGSNLDGPLAHLTVELCATVLQTCGAFPDIEAGRHAMREVLTTGRAAERFGRMAAALGAPSDFVEAWDRHLPQAPVIVDVPAGTGGTVTAVDGRAIGMAVVRMGGGRMKGGDPIDPAVGLSRVVRLGDTLGTGDPLARVHAADKASAAEAASAVAAAITLGSGAPVDHTLIHRRLT